MQTALTRPLPAFDWQIFGTIVRRELRDSLRDWRIVFPTLLLTCGFPFIMNFTAAVLFNFLRGYNATLIGERLLPFGVLIVGFFPMTFSLVIALETFVGERERNSLEALLATPASDAELYLGKLAAAILLPMTASLAGIGFYLIGVWYTRNWLPEPDLLALGVLLTLMEGLVMVSGAVIVSSHTTSVRAANLLASFIIVPMALLVQLEAWLIFVGSPQTLWYVALALAVVDVIMMRAGLRTFNRESILSRELDHINLHWLLTLFLAFFRLAPDEQQRIAAGVLVGDRPFSVRRVYQHDLPLLLQRNRLALGVTVTAMLAGGVVGLLYASVWPLPEAALDMSRFNAEDFRGKLARTTPGWNLLPEFSAWAVFSHNVRALLLAAIASVLSFGALALLLLLVPMAIIGYLAGQFSMVGESPWRFLLAFIVPHGIIELPAAIIATAFAVRVGAVMIAPPAGFTAGEGFLQALADFAKVFLFVVAPLLILAAAVEVYITPEIVIMLYGR